MFASRPNLFQLVDCDLIKWRFFVDYFQRAGNYTQKMQPQLAKPFQPDIIAVFIPFGP